ncbi:flagellar hook-length control protein FliK [Paracoccus ravus]|uniref:flagellar hook-length control protein FliK n=1 Tax=Paracoccus ravus TaxID=2447760 RepID=UPI001FD6E656|nr:flagellar hook-length control protein FliK [Paracoccus ravus]
MENVRSLLLPGIPVLTGQKLETPESEAVNFEQFLRQTIAKETLPAEALPLAESDEPAPELVELSFKHGDPAGEKDEGQKSRISRVDVTAEIVADPVQPSIVPRSSTETADDEASAPGVFDTHFTDKGALAEIPRPRTSRPADQTDPPSASEQPTEIGAPLPLPHPDFSRREENPIRPTLSLSAAPGSLPQENGETAETKLTPEFLEGEAFSAGPLPPTIPQAVNSIPGATATLAPPSQVGSENSLPEDSAQLPDIANIPGPLSAPVTTATWPVPSANHRLVLSRGYDLQPIIQPPSPRDMISPPSDEPSETAMPPSRPIAKDGPLSAPLPPSSEATPPPPPSEISIPIEKMEISDRSEPIPSEIIWHKAAPMPGHVVAQAVSPVPVAAEPREIARHLTERLSAGDDDVIEITLTPEELGKVRLIVVNGDKLTISVYADNRETLELMRRNADALSRELRDAGLSGASLTFGDREGGAQHPKFTQRNSAFVGAEPLLESAAERPETIREALSLRRLDMRI